MDLDALHTDSTSLDQLVNLKNFSTENVANALIWRSEHDQLYVRAPFYPFSPLLLHLQSLDLHI